jgi:hypothetical protein
MQTLEIVREDPPERFRQKESSVLGEIETMVMLHERMSEIEVPEQVG